MKYHFGGFGRRTLSLVGTLSTPWISWIQAAATLDTFTTEKLAKADLVMEEKLGSETLGDTKRCGETTKDGVKNGWEQHGTA